MRGRPKKTDSDRRDQVLRIRVTADEKQAIEDAAAGAALDSSAWARMVLLAQAKKDDASPRKR